MPAPKNSVTAGYPAGDRSHSTRWRGIVSEKNALALSIGVRALAVIPAIVWGFASTVGTVAVTGRPVTMAAIGNPVLMAAVAIVFGGLFGIASEWIARSITHSRTAHPLPAQEHSG
jgi:hypothetical protein